AMALVITGLVVVLRDLGLAPAIVQAPDLTQRLASTAFWLNLGLGLALAALLVIAAPLFGLLLNEPILTPVLAVLAIPVAVGSLSTVQQARLERAMRFRELGLLETGAQVVGIVVATLVAIEGGGVWSLVSQAVVTTLLTTIALWLVAGWRPSLLI